MPFQVVSNGNPPLSKSCRPGAAFGAKMGGQCPESPDLTLGGPAIVCSSRDTLEHMEMNVCVRIASCHPPCVPGLASIHPPRPPCLPPRLPVSWFPCLGVETGNHAHDMKTTLFSAHIPPCQTGFLPETPAPLVRVPSGAVWTKARLAPPERKCLRGLSPNAPNP